MSLFEASSNVCQLEITPVKKPALLAQLKMVHAFADLAPTNSFAAANLNKISRTQSQVCVMTEDFSYFFLATCFHTKNNDKIGLRMQNFLFRFYNFFHNLSYAADQCKNKFDGHHGPMQSCGNTLKSEKWRRIPNAYCMSSFH